MNKVTMTIEAECWPGLPEIVEGQTVKLCIGCEVKNTEWRVVSKGVEEIHLDPHQLAMRTTCQNLKKVVDLLASFDTFYEPAIEKVSRAISEQLDDLDRIRGIEKEARGSLAAMMALAKREGAVIYKNDETGEWVWAVTMDNGFWLDAFKTKKEAIKFCKQHSIKIRRT